MRYGVTSRDAIHILRAYGIRLAGIMALIAVLLPTNALADSTVSITGTLPTTDTFGMIIEASLINFSQNILLASGSFTGLSGAFSEQLTVLGSTVPNSVLIAGQSSGGLNSCGFSTATGSLSGYSFLPFCSFFGGFTTQSDGSLVATFNIWEAATTIVGGINGNGQGTPVEIGSGTITITQTATTPEPGTLSLTLVALLGLVSIVGPVGRKRLA